MRSRTRKNPLSAEATFSHHSSPPTWGFFFQVYTVQRNPFKKRGFHVEVMKSLSAFSPLPMDISHGKLVSWTVRTHTPRSFLQERVIYHYNILPATVTIVKGLHAHFILIMSSWLLYLSQLEYSTSRSLLHTFVVDTLLNLPTPFNIILTKPIHPT